MFSVFSVFSVRSVRSVRFVAAEIAQTRSIIVAIPMPPPTQSVISAVP